MKMIFNGTVLDNSQLSEFQRAIVISLFTWRRADDSDEYDGLSKFGWWGDTFPEHDNDRIGSKLYQLLRKKITDDILIEAEEMCNEALQWLIDDKLVESFSCKCERSVSDISRLNVTVSYVLTNSNIQNLLRFLEV